MRKYVFVCAVISLSYFSGCKQSTPVCQNDNENRNFISHRGVHMRSTIAGENSLKAIQLAKMAGFQSIETDVRLTADSCLVIMHDSTLNRTCLNADGTSLDSVIPIRRKTLQELKSNYILKATDPTDRSQIPTLKEFLIECKRNELYTFIEPKLLDKTGKHYQEIIKLADEISGRDNYVITSNNQANRIIRRLGINDVKLMGILYQTTFEEIQKLGNAIMAISATRFESDEYSQLITQAKNARLLVESHADKFQHFDKINNNDVDFISTDILAPDFNDQGRIILEINNNDFIDSDRDSQSIVLDQNELLELKTTMSYVIFGALYLKVEMEAGELEIKLNNQKFRVESVEKKRLKYQPMIYENTPTFSIKALSDKVIIRSIDIKVVSFMK